MGTYNHSESVIVSRYLPEITTFINAIVQEESVAIVIACSVFEQYKKRNEKEPFDTEKNRSNWLFLYSRQAAIAHLQRLRNEEIKKQATRTAIHDHP